MKQPSKDIVTLLGNETSLGLTILTDLFHSRMPSKPDNVVVVYDNPGDAPALALQKKTSDYFFSSVNVRVRNKDYETGWELMKAISDFLHGSSQDVVDGTYYALIRALNDPQLLRWDEGNDRAEFFVNFEVQRRDN